MKYYLSFLIFFLKKYTSYYLETLAIAVVPNQGAAKLFKI